eukprot:2070099-Prymnesium_polylepis.1
MRLKRSRMSAVATAKRCSLSRYLLFRRRQLASVVGERWPSGVASGERGLRFIHGAAAGCHACVGQEDSRLCSGPEAGRPSSASQCREPHRTSSPRHMPCRVS